MVTTAPFALGVALLTKFGSSGPSFDALLFGSILGVSSSDVLLVVVALLVAVTVLMVRHRALLFSTFDRDIAAVSGVRVARVEALLMVVLSLAILATLTVIGVTLVAATLVTPAVVARLLTDSFTRSVTISTVVGTVGGFIGMNLSWHADVPFGTMSVLVEATVFLVAFAVSSLRRLRRLPPQPDAVATVPPQLSDARRGAPASA